MPILLCTLCTGFERNLVNAEYNAVRVVQRNPKDFVMKRIAPTTAFPIDTVRAESAPSLKKTLAVFFGLMIAFVQLLDLASKNSW